LQATSARTERTGGGGGGATETTGARETTDGAVDGTRAMGADLMEGSLEMRAQALAGAATRGEGGTGTDTGGGTETTAIDRRETDTATMATADGGTETETKTERAEETIRSDKSHVCELCTHRHQQQSDSCEELKDLSR
jgi:hypothetical protein